MRLDGTVGDSYDNATDESVNGVYKTELVWRRKPFADLAELELATFRWVSWWNSKRLHQSLGYRTPDRSKPSIMQTKRYKPPHYEGGKKSVHISPNPSTVHTRPSSSGAT